MQFPFEVEFDEVQSNLDTYVDAVIGCLNSEFLIMPKGEGFIEFSVFEEGYEALKKSTSGFRDFTVENVENAVYRKPISLVVLRSILGFTPPEWAYYASQHSGIEISQSAARTIDRNIRLDPARKFPKRNGVIGKRVRSLVSAACFALKQGIKETASNTIHRLDKADTKGGLVSLRSSANLGIPYSMLLYERFLGRPFAAHRDSVSELIGDIVENAIESELFKNGISYRKTKRAEKLEGFDQAPDFVIPNEFNPRVVIEAKLTEDDGTARDKVTRVQHLASLSMARQPSGRRQFEVIACIAGRGFGVRREDMKKLLLSTRGKVFTIQNMNKLVDNTHLKEYKSSLIK